MQMIVQVHGMVWYSSIYIAPLNSGGPKEMLLVRLPPRKETNFKRYKEVERLDDKKEARADGGRRFQREGRASDRKRSRFSHSCRSPMDKELPPVKGA